VQTWRHVSAIVGYQRMCLLLQSHQRRTLSSIRTQQPGSLPDYHVDPYRLLEDDLKHVYDDIREVGSRPEPELSTRVVAKCRLLGYCAV
jgi:hypothetical protein